MRVAKVVVRSLWILTALYLVFDYLGGFSPRQSGALAVAGWMGFEYCFVLTLREINRAETVPTPFRVRVRPIWERILREFKLVQSDEEWDRICERAANVPVYEYNVIRSGIEFTVLKALPWLIYWDGRGKFTTEVEFAEAIVDAREDAQPGLVERKHPHLNHPLWASLPGVYFKLVGEEFEFGLVVQQDWWERLCGSGEIGELKNLRSHVDHSKGMTVLVLATLPLTEFADYFVDPGSFWGQVRLRKDMKARDEARVQNGWKGSEYDPDTLEHRYFIVQHDDLRHPVA